MKYMYGLGFSVRNTRYTSNGSAGESMSRRWEMTTEHVAVDDVLLGSFDGLLVVALLGAEAQLGLGDRFVGMLTRDSSGAGVAASRCIWSSRATASL